MRRSDLQRVAIEQVGFDAPLAKWSTLLESLDVFRPGTLFDEDVWEYVDGPGRNHLDWRALRSFEVCKPFRGALNGGSIAKFAKKLLLAMMDEHRVFRSDHRIGSKRTHQLFDTILLTLGYCVENSCNQVRDVKSYAAFIMMHSVSSANPSAPLRTRRTPISFYTLETRIADQTWARVTNHETGWPQIGFGKPLNESLFRAAQRRFIQNFYDGEMSWGDYRQGGSLDKFGLDDGQHYVAHCFSLIERYSEVAKLIQEIYLRIIHPTVLNLID